MLRDVLLTRIPAILAKEIYATAALVAAVIAVRYSWGLPVVGRG